MDNSSNKITETIDFYRQHEFYFGLSLAIASSFFIGSSFIIKKKALIRLNKGGCLRAGAGGYGYLKEWIWWMGLLTMGIGEVANFAAYAFAPASLVTPLGALSVLVTAVLSSKFLKERLNLLGKLGCLLCIIGSTVIVLHSPKENNSTERSVIDLLLNNNLFIGYVAVILLICLAIAFYMGPRYGHIHVSIYIIMCSAIGSLTVMSCKALGIAIRDTLSGRSNDFLNPFTYFLLLTTIVFICIQMNYLNKALDIFSTCIVTPIYYVTFTTLVIVASALLFDEWQQMSVFDVVGDICGFMTVIVAIILLNAFQQFDISLADIRAIMRPKKHLLDDGCVQMEEVLVRNSSGRHTYGTNDRLRL